MPARPDTAVILAAGEGRRLAGMWKQPKGLLRFGRETLIERSLRLLESRGIKRVILVTGYQSEAYEALLKDRVEIVRNPEFSTTGSMASLARALHVVKHEFVLLESDLAYAARGLDSLLACAARDAVLASGPTGATDEVWIDAPNGRIRGLRKEAPLAARHGEFVGLSRISAELAGLMMEAFDRYREERGHALMSYDSDALPVAASQRPVSMVLVSDLLWGEVDDAFHYARMRDQVWPALDEPGNG